MKKKFGLMVVLLALLCVVGLTLLPTVAKAEEVASGKCGTYLKWVLTDDGVLTISGTGKMDSYNGDSSTAPWFSKRAEITSVVIEDGVTSIGVYAFYDCDNLSSVTIPDGVTIIDSSAFRSCDKISSITIPDSVQTLGHVVFENCNSLSSITIPANVSIIGKFALAYCSNLKEIIFLGHPTLIMENAFCGTYARVYYPEDSGTWSDSDMQDYGGIILWGEEEEPLHGTCGDNVTWVLDVDRVLTISGTGAMYDYYYNYSTYESTAPWGTTELARLVNSVNIEDGVTGIGDYAFAYCYGLKSINIPESICDVGQYVFYKCSSLEYCVYEDLKYIGNEENPYLVLFDYVSDDNSKCVIHPKTKVIAEYAFVNYGFLQTVIVPASVTNICTDAFHCSSNALDAVVFLGDAPAFASKTFWTNTTIYTLLPWDESVQQNYGGNLTWCSGADQVEYRISPDSSKFCRVSQPLQVPNILGVLSFGETAFEVVLGEATQVDSYDNSQPGSKNVTVFYNDTPINYEYIVFTDDHVNVEIPGYVTFNGENGTIIPKIHCFGSQLVEGIDYEIEYINNTAASNDAQIIIRGLGAFEGWSTCETFAILKADIRDAIIDINACSYNGMAQTPGVSVTLNDIVLTSGTDYLVKYIDNIEVGTATVQIIGTGNYTGIIEKSFEIAEKNDVRFKITDSKSTIYACDQWIIIDCIDQLFVGFELYKNGILVSYEDSFSSNIYVSSYDFREGAGTYTLKVYTQGYTYIVQGGQYKPVPKGSKSWKTYTVYVSEPTTATAPTSITALEPLEVDFRTLYLGIETGSNTNPFPQKWETSDPDIATVTNGIVTLHKAGQVTITVTIGELQATWDINTEQLDITKGTALFYDASTQTPVLAYDSVLLVEGQDYTFSFQTDGSVDTVTITGCGLFSGTLVRRYAAGTANIVACDHIYSDWVDAGNGNHSKKCSICKDVQTELHTLDNGIVNKEATCIEEGTITYTCAVCGGTKTDTIPKAETHSYGDGVVTKEATCIDQGEMAYTCSLCGYSYTEATPVSGHNYDRGICTVCGDAEYVIGDVNGDGKINTNDAKLIMHYELRITDESELNMSAADVNGDGKINTSDAKLIMQYELGLIPEMRHNWIDATCTAPKTCTSCGITEGSALGHNWEEATCTESKLCKTCGATEGAPMGHNWIGATCTEAGTCSRCDVISGEALGHDMENNVCTRCGYEFVAILYEDSKIKITLKSIEKSSYIDGRVELYFFLENKTSETLLIQADAISLNGYSFCSLIMSDRVSPDSIGTINLTVNDIDFDLLDTDNIESIGGQFRIINDDYSDRYTATWSNVMLDGSGYTYYPDDFQNDFVVYDDSNCTIYFKSAEKGSYGDRLEAYLLVKNKTDRTLLIQADSFAINGYSYSNLIVSDRVLAKAVGIVNISVNDFDFDIVDYTNITKIGGQLRIIYDDYSDRYTVTLKTGYYTETPDNDTPDNNTGTDPNPDDGSASTSSPRQTLIDYIKTNGILGSDGNWSYMFYYSTSGSSVFSRLAIYDPTDDELVYVSMTISTIGGTEYTSFFQVILTDDTTSCDWLMVEQMPALTGGVATYAMGGTVTPSKINSNTTSLSYSENTFPTPSSCQKLAASSLKVLCMDMDNDFVDCGLSAASFGFINYNK